MEVKDQLLGIASLLPLWVLGVTFRSLGLCDRYFYPLRHHTGPRNVVLKLENAPGLIRMERDQ